MPIPLPTLNVLDAITIPSHCPIPWEEMEGGDRTRFCSKCDQHVHDIAELTIEDAVRLLTGSERPPCIRIYRRDDGRVMTADCTTRRERTWKWLRRRSSWTASLFAVWFLSGCRTAYQGYMVPQDSRAAVKIAELNQSPGTTTPAGPSIPPPDFANPSTASKE